MRITSDHTAVRGDGTIIVFSIERFVRDVITLGHCFVCGRNETEVAFNDEHIIPNWLLRRCRLQDAVITLPNGTHYHYDRYTIPCCKPCNSKLGKVFEEPLAEVFAKGRDAIIAYTRVSDGAMKLFVWLALIYLKTHLKDLSLRLHRDRREPNAKIADEYDWAELHHVHCLARAYLAGVTIDPQVMGSLLVLPAKAGPEGGRFDYGDNYRARTVCLRVEDTALFAVLNDARAVLLFRTDTEQCDHRPSLTKIRHALSPVQVREMLAELVYTNLRIRERPTFMTLIDPLSEEAQISVQAPEGYHLRTGSKELWGSLLYHLCEERIAVVSEPERSDLAAKVQTGEHSFLWDMDGNQADYDL